MLYRIYILNDYLMKYLRFFSDESTVVENLNVKHYAQFIKNNEAISYYVKTNLILHNEIAGKLKESFIESDSSVKYIEYLKISGNLNSTDIKFIREMCELNNKHNARLSILDMSECNIIEGGEAYLILNGNEYKTRNNDLGEYTFYNSNLSKCILPNNLSNIETNVFNGSKLLHTIELNKLPIPASSAKLLIQKVNGFLFAKEKFSIEDGYVSNVIIENDYNSFVELKDKEDYILDKDIKVKSCSFVKYFSKPTKQGKSMGWETILLPFKPTKIEGKNRRNADVFLVPFDSDETPFVGKLVLNFWLRKYNNINYDNIIFDNIDKNILYIISMPNDPIAYNNTYNVMGDVYFTAESKGEDFILLEKTKNTHILQDYNNEMMSVGTYILIKDAQIKYNRLLKLNTEGSLFDYVGVENTEYIYPFEWGIYNK